MTGRSPSPRGPFSFGVAGIIVACYSVAGTAAALVPGLDHAGRTLAVGTVLGCLAGIAAWFAAPRLAAPPPPRLPAPPARALHPETERLADRLRFDRQLDRALDRVTDRAGVLTVAARALDAIPPAAPAELLLLGQKGRNLVQVAHVGPDGDGPGCPVACPGRCEAMRANRTLRFASGEDLDACRHLRERDVAGWSATCVPVRMLGTPVGVLHRLDPAGTGSDGDLSAGYLESMATKIEARLTALQLTGTDTQPGPDVDVDGVADRHALEQHIAELNRSFTPFALARCDIDHFESYVADHGGELGDEALRTLGRAAQRCMRPADVIARGGDGDALVALFPSTRAADGRRALERVREELALELTAGAVPQFTMSAAVVQAELGRALGDLLAALDATAARARALGHNRVLLADEAVETTSDN